MPADNIVYRTINQKVFRCRYFGSDEEANAFMVANPGWGVLDVNDFGTVYVAEMPDKGQYLFDLAEKAAAFDMMTKGITDAAKKDIIKCALEALDKVNPSSPGKDKNT